MSTFIPTILYIPFFFEKDYFEELKNSIIWERIVWGKNRKLQRLIYSYDPLGNNEIINEIVNIIENNFNLMVHTVWCNYYRDGNDFIPFHNDKIGNFGVCSVSFGEKRDFIFKKKDKKIKYELGQGDVLIFNNATNLHFKHGLPKRKNKNGRINLTMFCILGDDWEKTVLNSSEFIKKV